MKLCNQRSIISCIIAFLCFAIGRDSKLMLFTQDHTVEEPNNSVLIATVQADPKRRIIELYNNILKKLHSANYIKTIINIPINKQNKDKTVIISYRPIALYPLLANILDEIIANRLLPFLTNQKLTKNINSAFKSPKPQ